MMDKTKVSIINISISWVIIGVICLSVQAFQIYYGVVTLIIGSVCLYEWIIKKENYYFSFLSFLILMAQGVIFYFFPRQENVTEMYFLCVLMPFFLPFYLWLALSKKQGKELVIYIIFLIGYALVSTIIIPTFIYTNMIPFKWKEILFLLPSILSCGYSLWMIILRVKEKLCANNL